MEKLNKRFNEIMDDFKKKDQKIFLILQKLNLTKILFLQILILLSLIHNCKHRLIKTLVN